MKVFTAYNNRLRLQDGEIFQVLRLAKKHNLLTMLHAENGDVIDILIADALAQVTPHLNGMPEPALHGVQWKQSCVEQPWLHRQMHPFISSI